ncbi:MAG TPA: transcriptional regulator [candidate division Zixibacteria bacterium]|nr:transcriptional regulator [candidate division Zixibacteria bacterium]
MVVTDLFIWRIMTREEKAAYLLRTIGDQSRFKIISLLLDKPLHVSEIVRKVKLQQSLVSHHLKVLRELGILQSERKGPFIKYSVAKPEIVKIIMLAKQTTL